MATGTHTLIQRITVGAAGAVSVTFNSIPQTGYTDLKIVVSARTTVALIDTYFNCNFNGDSGANYSQRSVYQGNTGNATSNSFSAVNNLYVNSVVGANATASTFSNVEMYIPNYAGSTYKSMSQDGANEHNAANPTTRFNPLSAGLWSSTAAITSIALSTASGTWVQYSTFSLYGIAAYGTTPTKAPKATGGDIIQTDGTYWYHAFINTGAFVPATGLTADVLVVAGGGGGGIGYGGGGGGAGGLLYFSQQSLTTASYNAVVGAGGPGANNSTTFNGTNGNNSSFFSLTSAIGGGGGGRDYGGGFQGNNGGSGGGTGDYPNTGETRSLGTSGQGYGGGAGSSGGAGGGGGAGGAGGDAGGSAGAGGVGSSVYSSFALVTRTGQIVSGTGYYAGGGGGGTRTGSGFGAGGSGGGGTGGANNGTANSGGGGGGNASTGSAVVNGAGGSGLIIVRYAV